MCNRAGVARELLLCLPAGSCLLGQDSDHLKVHILDTRKIDPQLSYEDKVQSIWLVMKDHLSSNKLEGATSPLSGTLHYLETVPQVLCHCRWQFKMQHLLSRGSSGERWQVVIHHLNLIEGKMKSIPRVLEKKHVRKQMDSQIMKKETSGLIHLIELKITRSPLHLTGLQDEHVGSGEAARPRYWAGEKGITVLQVGTEDSSELKALLVRRKMLLQFLILRERIEILHALESQKGSLRPN